MRKKKNKPKRKNKSVYSHSKSNTSNETSIIQSESPLLVFVSYRGSMEAEREVVRSAIDSIPIMRSWIFQYTPASSQKLEDSYLSQVRACDLFVLLLGLEYSDAVAREYHIAVETEKPILAFIQRGDRDAKQDEIVGSITTKPLFYTKAQDLHNMVLPSVFDEINRRFKSTLKQSEFPKLIESMPVPVRDPQEVAGCVIVGMEDDTMAKVFEFFDVSRPPDNLAEAYPSYEQVYFDNFAEMKEVFDALTTAATKANQATGDRKKVYLQSLREQSLEIASHYMKRKRTGVQPPQIKVEGIKYFLWSVAPDVARLMELMRLARTKDTRTTVTRTEYEYLFRSPDYLLLVFSALHQARKEAGDDLEEFLRLLLLSAMRLRLPNLEDYADDQSDKDES